MKVEKAQWEVKYKANLRKKLSGLKFRSPLMGCLAYLYIVPQLPITTKVFKNEYTYELFRF